MFSDRVLSWTALTYSPALKRPRSNSRLERPDQSLRVFTVLLRNPAMGVSKAMAQTSWVSTQSTR